MKFLIILSSLFLILSCRKQAVCKGNCTDVRVSGRVYDPISNSGLANQSVQVKWRRNGMCFFGCEFDLTTGSTDNNGNFDFWVTVDTSKFIANYRLSVEFPTPKGYLNDNSLYSSVYLYKYSPAGLSNIQIAFLPKADLTVRLHRTLSDNFINFYNDVFYINGHTRMSTGYSIYSPNLAKDTTFQRETVAGAYTFITWRKVTAPGIYSEHKDSLICTRSGPNIFDIYY